METYLGHLLPGLVPSSSYRTYEEWKPYCNHAYYLMTYHRSYRTYEEWKPSQCNVSRWNVQSSYRTYEEWKLSSQPRSLTTSSTVLTVPMRNGNTSLLFLLLQLRAVLTVPMRNGNLLPLRPHGCGTVPVLTVPMRNGNAELWNTRGRLYLFLPYL